MALTLRTVAARFCPQSEAALQPRADGPPQAVEVAAQAVVAGQRDHLAPPRGGRHPEGIGHPLHVILTDVPIGAWTAAEVFDVLEVARSSDGCRKAADTSIAIGIIAALGASALLVAWRLYFRARAV